MSRQKGFWLLLAFLALLGLWGGYRAVRAGGNPASDHTPVVQARFTAHLGFVFWQADPALLLPERVSPRSSGKRRRRPCPRNDAGALGARTPTPRG
ncbi:MAG TPA: hypothetical protein G4O04_00570 [Anaerolineae bacterium]|nr:hypothetical protein [Anaerolineae bacterium]HID85235.1 hypothetical protein [Anaerolineales bacterium]HIQ09077.1 hypothetical protein [Anaerolineaceae bacterium]